VVSADLEAKLSPEQLEAVIVAFLARHREACVIEDGKVAFDLRAAQYKLSSKHGRCTLHLWSGERSAVRTIVAAEERGDALVLTARRIGHTQTKRMEIVAADDARAKRRATSTRERDRAAYQGLLERLLPRFFPDLKAEGLRTSMDLERSFGPAYVRGALVPRPQALIPKPQALPRPQALVEGQRAWALIAVSDRESAAMIDGVLTAGILWLAYCREHGGGRVLYEGLKVIVPRGAALLTAARMAWLHPAAARWELWELDGAREEMTRRDLDDQGNLDTRLVHHPDERAAQERFADAVRAVMALAPDGEEQRVEQRLRSSTELAFLLHGLEFARARVTPAANSFAHQMTVTIGVGVAETELTESTREEMRELVADLFARRRASFPPVDFGTRARPLSRRIGSAALNASAHSRLQMGTAAGKRQLPASQDPLYRAAPEKWLESVLRANLTPLTRGLAATPAGVRRTRTRMDANEDEDEDAIGNRADAPQGEEAVRGVAWSGLRSRADKGSLIPRLDPAHVYAQVSAIAGAGDKGLLDLLGVTADGRLAVIEIKADDDMQFALQGLDYWIRVRQHHLAAPDAATGLGTLQRHGYFRDVELSPLTPRLFLVAPALRIHPRRRWCCGIFRHAWSGSCWRWMSGGGSRCGWSGGGAGGSGFREGCWISVPGSAFSVGGAPVWGWGVSTSW
jgi:hypothetical protein